MDKQVSTGQYRKFLDILDQKGVTGDGFQQRLDTGALADFFDPAAVIDRNALRIALKLSPLVGDVFRFTVDYGQTLEQMIAAGHYDWKNSDITAKRFPVEGKGIVEFEGRYFHFNRNISSENAVSGIESVDTKNPWMPAKIEHVLSHGATFPDEQRKFPIVGLGSVAKVLGFRYVPCLSKDGSGRDLYLGWFDDDWYPIFRFLAVRKVSGS